MIFLVSGATVTIPTLSTAGWAFGPSHFSALVNGVELCLQFLPDYVSAPFFSIIIMDFLSFFLGVSMADIKLYSLCPVGVFGAV